MSKYLIMAVIFTFIIFWVWALLDLAFSTFKKTNWKLAWLLVILFFPLIGSVLYLLLRKEFKVEQKRSFDPGFMPDNNLLERRRDYPKD